MIAFSAGHAPCSPAAGASFLAAQDIADEAFERHSDHLHRMMWEQVQRADSGTVTAVFETLAGGIPHPDKATRDSIKESVRELVRLGANGNELNEQHCRKAFGLLQRVLRDVAAQWAREDGAQ